MAARGRTTLTVQLFVMHPIRKGLEVGASIYIQLAAELAVDLKARLLRCADIKQCFRDGKELLSWLSHPRSQQELDELDASVLSHIVQAEMRPQLKLKFASHVGRPGRGRPTETKFLAVLALEAKLARPEVKWKQITGFVCQCGKLEHNDCCVENLEAQVRRLRALLRRTGLARLIIANAKPPLLKRNLQELIGEGR